MKARMGEVSIKRLVYSGMLLAAMLVISLLCFPANANAEECDHRQPYSHHYEKIDDETHASVYTCNDCGEVMSSQTFNHEFWSVDYDEVNYEKLDDNYHIEKTGKCWLCGAIKYEKKKHSFNNLQFPDGSFYKNIDNKYHQVVCQCVSCGTIVSKKEEHIIDSWYQRDRLNYRKLDDNYHVGTQKCFDCGATVIGEKEKHYLGEAYEHDAPYKRTRVDDKYHEETYYCDYCNEYVNVKERHDKYSGDYKSSYSLDSKNHIDYYKCQACKGTYSTEPIPHEWDYYVIRKASLNKKAKLQKYCFWCEKKKGGIFKKKWKKGTEYSLKYGIKSHSDVYSYTTKLRVKLLRPSKGAVVKVKIGKKIYKKKVRGNKKKIVIKIQPPIGCGMRMSIKLLYKGKVIGKDLCGARLNDEIWYSTKLSVGMTKKQARWTWGSPKSKTSSSGGVSTWWYDDYSYIIFKNGRVAYWYNAAG